MVKVRLIIMSKKDKDKLPIIMTTDEIDYDSLTEDQKREYKRLTDWYFSKNKKKKPIWRLGGYAGVGKDHLIKFFIQQQNFMRNECYVVAYTGQAVNVMRQRGVYAKTIHSTFMHPMEVPLYNNKGEIIMRRGIPVTTMKFVPVKKLPDTVKLIICNEASFVSDETEKLMLRYNVPILEVGDPLQLPPVTGKQAFTMENLDGQMNQIMRQRKDSEIIQLATAIRYYNPIDTSSFNTDVRFLRAHKYPEDTFSAFRPFFKHADIILTATNKERDVYTTMYREQILGTKSPYPLKGEPLVCRRSDWSLTLEGYPLTNGTRGYAVHKVGMSEVDTKHNVYSLDFRPEFIQNDYFDNLQCDLNFLRFPFGEKEDDVIKYNPGKKFEYAHAMSVHLSQGSSFENVLFCDKYIPNIEFGMRLRYTAVTRASKRLVYILPYSKY